jgi:hypothetical protein
VGGMNPLQRRRLLQTGLASAGVLGAVGVSLGLAGATHPASGAQAGTQGTQGAQHSQSSKQSRESDDGGTSSKSRSSSQSRPNPSVSAPQPSPPQATTSGS